MPKLFPLLLCWLITSASSSQAPPTFPDTPTITETSVGKARIGMPIARLKELYRGCTFAPAYTRKYGSDSGSEKPDGVIVSWHQQKLLLYCAGYSYDSVTNKVSATNRVAQLIALHPAYRTTRGIHVGSTSRALKAAFPAMRLAPALIAPDFQSTALDGSSIYYIFFGQQYLGPQNMKNEESSAPIAVETGKISWIQVHPF